MLRISTIIAFTTCFTVAMLAQVAAGPVHVSTGVMLGLVEHKTMPLYPDDAMKKGIAGDVLFKINVDETGKITASVPSGGDPLLVAASKASLQTFHFRPYLLNGTPTKIEGQVGFHFSVEKSADAVDGRVNGHVECIASIPDRQ